ncbi:MAG: hypothetical protein ACFCUR_21745 [Rhodomicrobiaceae bacterium]
MTTKYSREELLKQLQDVLDCHGATPSCWPERCRARLSAFVESDHEAARIYTVAKALDRTLCCAPKGECRPEIEARIFSLAMSLPQSRNEPSATILEFQSAASRERQPLRVMAAIGPERRPMWGAALLAASLILGVYIGVSGEAIPALQNMTLLTSEEFADELELTAPLFGREAFQESDRL